MKRIYKLTNKHNHKKIILRLSQLNDYKVFELNKIDLNKNKIIFYGKNEGLKMKV